MGMMLRRRDRNAAVVEPKVNGKPVVKPPKTKKLNLDPVYPETEVKVNTQTTSILNKQEKITDGLCKCSKKQIFILK